MADIPSIQLNIETNAWEKTLTLSSIPDIWPPEKARETFFSELFNAIKSIQDLRATSKGNLNNNEQQKIKALLYKIIETVETWYRPIRAYTIDCASIRDMSFNHPDRVIDEADQRKIVFQETCGSIILEFGGPITSLKGYIELYQMPDTESHHDKFLAAIDKIILGILEALTLLQKQLQKDSQDNI
ncbi:MAG: hypothetical protein AAF485_03705 [Chloroflexota bacterium]